MTSQFLDSVNYQDLVDTFSVVYSTNYNLSPTNGVSVDCVFETVSI